MNQKKQSRTTFLKAQLAIFFQTEDFRKAAILQTIAVIYSTQIHDWWSVDLRTMVVIHRATEIVYPHYHCPEVLALQMLAETELLNLMLVVGLEDLDLLIQANREHRYGADLAQLPQKAHKQLTDLAAALGKHSHMLVDTKRLMRRQL